MKDNLLIGIWRSLVGLPRSLWQRHVESDAQHTEARLGFMTTAHHLVRHFAVRELPRVGRPLSPELIARGVNLPLPRVNEILDELEKNKTFLFRNPQGAVTWAYPVTVEETPHRVTFSTGEAIYAA
jgi:hypothetical protein